MVEKLSNVRSSELRRFLLGYAKRKGYRVQEFVSDELHQPICFYAHVEIPAIDGTHRRTATALSHETHDTALAKAFLYLGNGELDFID